uniref:NADH dehydrogenase subunit 2 n=1 Tax=Sternocampsus coriaceus TaxID=3041292 RepID=UPI002551F05A|nr:NADH dehydrogenase subunit 2 [Sternocampsus coriaceus]WGF20842.1 NADH dehydrogenase subunit 2 [Sternocampsus coriaceus]
MTKTYKTLFISTLFLSTMISISAYSWLGMWLGLEINLLSIIPLMQSIKNKLSAEASVKYFTVQAIASTIILMSVILMTIKINLPTNTNFKSTILMSMNSALLTKMGMAPFHFWFPEVMEGLDWMNCLLILTWQKIAPMILLMYNMLFINFTSIIILIAMIISGVMAMNQISLRKILAYSSINHMGWMISTMMIMETVWFYYFLIYAIISINLVMVFKNSKVFFINQLHQIMNSNKMIKLFFMLNFLSLSGIPPFLGFLPKWFTIQILTQNNMMFLPTIMIIFTLIMIFVYLRIMISTLLMNINESNWNSSTTMTNLKSFWLSLFNFFTIWNLIIVTMIINIL